MQQEFCDLTRCLSFLRREGSMLLMDMRPEPTLPGESFKFNRMISDDTALYDYTESPDQGNAEGQIAVAIDPSYAGMELGPSTEHPWKVQPMGVLKGTNLLGATIQVPLIKFRGYCDYWKYANMGLGDPCMQDMPPEALFGAPVYPGATRLAGNEGFDAFTLAVYSRGPNGRPILGPNGLPVLEPAGQQVDANYETPDFINDVVAFYKSKFGAALKVDPAIGAFSINLERGQQRTVVSIVPCELSRVRPRPWCSQGAHGTSIRLKTSM
jgi:hypothetical protein